MPRGVHGEKLYAAMNSAKLPATDKPRLKAALDKYDVWIEQVNDADAPTLEELIKIMVSLLQEYKYYIDVTLIFDSPNDFLYRQKGQTKIDNTVIEEFLPVFVRKCLIKQYGQCDLVIGTQQKVFSSAFFDSSLGSPQIGGGLVIKQKDQDFSMSRELFIRSSFDPSFSPNETKTWTTNIGYVLAEIKTNLDKTMFQEASATSHDVKTACTGAKYFLLCDYLDMTPINTATTDIEEILILRKAKRLASNIRSNFSDYNGRCQNRAMYVQYLNDHPYSHDVFKRFIDRIIIFMQETLDENKVLTDGFF